MNSNEIRQAFLDFFEERGHTFVPSNSLVPLDDPTLLFTNAGMNQFKPVLLGEEKRAYVRATNSQKCMRVSGKHNDLEAVGRDGRHHTFFEMLGNWSFGDYYKREAIEWAWHFLTEVMGLDQEKLLISVYKDDDESYQIWNEIAGVPAERIYRLGDIAKGDEENFWSMGDTGPCGPCTEIHFDQGPELAAGDQRPLGENDSDRYLEIWNLVFIQYDRDAEGELSPLPLQSVDTGMGLERLAALKAGVSSNYGSDLFQPLIQWVADESGRSPKDGEDRVSMQVIADHARALTFAVADGGRPGNDGGGYVLRRILRRAARHGRRLGLEEPFLYRVAEQVIEMMGGHYRELVEAKEHVLRVIRTEEERFNETLDRGLNRFAEFEAAARARGDNLLRGEDAFVLHDTFGFPLDLTQVMAEEKNMAVDEAGFQTAMEAQRKRSREGSRFAANDRGAAWRWLSGEPGADREVARFCGYDRLESRCRLLGVRPVDDELWELVVDPSPFYAESGGQVGDRGRIQGEGLLLEVMDTQPSGAGPVCTVKVLEGDLQAEGLSELELVASVDDRMRLDTMRNHTATHLLHRALHERLGSHATQAGSLVAPDRLRFDFHSDHGLGREELDLLEQDVNAKILEDRPVAKHVDVPLEEARDMGAVAMFGEKYGDKVRVIAVDDYSVEFCGGTHCDNTGQIGLFRIIAESAVQAGVRRIEAVTGQRALESFVRDRDIVRQLGDELSARVDELPDRVQALKSELKNTQQELTQSRRAAAGDQATEILDSAEEVDGIRLIARQVEVAERDDLLQMGDTLREKLGSGAAVLGTELDGKVAFLAVVTDDLIKKRGLKAGDLVKRVAAIAGGGGGGRPHLAQAGGKDPAKIPEAIAAVPAIVSELLFFLTPRAIGGYMNPILEMRGVSRSYGKVVAVDNVDLSVPRGSIYGVLGPNGAGKTTTIRMILKIYLPDAGEIFFDGRPLDRDATDRIGYLPEERGLYKRMRVEDQIVYLARLKGMDAGEARRRASLWLERFELSDRAKSKVDELSKGMQQKIQFIGTVISEPEMVVLDEPFSGLDPINVKLLREIIQEIQDAGRTVLFSTHVMEQAELICDHIFLINQGRKVLDGRLDRIVDEYPVDSVRVAGTFEVEALRRLSSVAEVEQNGNELKLKLAEGCQPQALLEQLVHLARVDRFSATRPPLSEIFIREVEASHD